MEFSDIPTEIWDTYGTKHTPTRLLGAGAQGVTCLTSNPKTILKIALGENQTILKDEMIKKELTNRIQYVRTLPIPSSINLTLPETTLRDLAGYRMNFLGDLESIRDHFYKRMDLPEGLPDYLAQRKQASRYYGYIMTGGLRRRLRAMGNLTALLAELQSCGIVYGDISPNNTFISQSMSECEVWLIDPDNLFEDCDPKWSIGIGTPPFMAPEVFKNETLCSMYSDAFAVAVMAFDLISTIHPFHGSMYKAGPDWMSADESGDKDFLSNSGMYPWVCDIDDPSNHANLLLPQSLLFTDELLALFWQMFVPGKLEPSIRPYISLWPQAFFRAASRTILCKHCGMSVIYHDENESDCPFCGHRYEPYLIVKVFSSDSELAYLLVYTKTEKEASSSLDIPLRAIQPVEMIQNDLPALRLSMSSGKLKIQKHQLCPAAVSCGRRGTDQVVLQSGESVGIPVEMLREFELFTSGRVDRRIVFEIHNGKGNTQC